MQQRGGADEAPDSPINPKTGEPIGIDKGFGYNVGSAAWGEGQAKALLEEKGAWRELPLRRAQEIERPSPMPAEVARAKPGTLVSAGDVVALRDAFKKAVGGDSVFIDGPKGDTVNANQVLPDQVAAHPKEQAGSERYFPFIPELIEDPYEVRVSFIRNEISGRVALRKLYLKAVRTGAKAAIELWAEIRDGFVIGIGDGAERLRTGYLIYGRK